MVVRSTVSRLLVYPSTSTGTFPVSSNTKFKPSNCIRHQLAYGVLYQPEHFIFGLSSGYVAKCSKFTWLIKRGVGGWGFKARTRLTYSLLLRQMCLGMTGLECNNGSRSRRSRIEAATRRTSAEEVDTCVRCRWHGMRCDAVRPVFVFTSSSSKSLPNLVASHLAVLGRNAKTIHQPKVPQPVNERHT